MAAERTREKIAAGDGYIVANHFQGSTKSPHCLLAPPFSIPAKVLGFVAEAMVQEGWSVTTFDPRDHVGSSSGDMADFTMSSYVHDCEVLINRLQPDLTIGMSLGARAVTRVLGSGAPCAAAVLVTPVVDLRSTVTTILGEDPFEGEPAHLPHKINIVGVDVKAPAFVTDSLEHGLSCRDKTAVDLGGFDGDVTFIAGTHDPWVGIGDVHLVAGESGSRTRDRKVRAVAADSHTINEDPELAMRVVGALLEETSHIGHRTSA